MTLFALSSRLSVSAVLAAGLLLSTGCHAQVPPATAEHGESLSPALQRRIEILIRSRAQLPFNYDVRVADRRPSATLPNFDEVTAMIGDAGKPGRPVTFLISKDNKTLAQLTTFDLTKDPKQLTTDAGRPARGGSESAPVKIVVFDDLECPFCAREHAALFPALLQRYGDKVRIAYKDFPLSQHPWAIHSEVNANCLAAQNGTAYWNYVDAVHARSSDIGGQEKSLTAAKIELDKMAMDAGTAAKLDAPKLKACVDKQDEAPVTAGLREGETLQVNGVPAIFINGQQINGAAPVEFIYRAIDEALVAEGVKPPPPVPLPAMDAPAR